MAPAASAAGGGMTQKGGDAAPRRGRRGTRYPRAALLLALAPAAAAQLTSIVSCVPEYPIAGSPLFDFDANCGMDWAGAAPTWASKTGAHVVIANLSLPSSARSFDSTRRVYRVIVSSGRKVTIPYDVGPTAHPDATVEVLVSVGSVPANSAAKALWSSDAPGSSLTGVTHGRALLAYEAAGSGSALVPWCPTAQVGATLAVGSGWLHIASVFSGSSASVYVNGVFSYTAGSCAQADGAGNLTINGRLGGSDADVSSQTLAYVRAWGRALTATEVLALALTATSNANLVNYSRPLLVSPYPYAAFNPSAGGTATVSASASASVANYLVERLHVNGSAALVTSGSVSVVSTALAGNFSYRVTFCWTLAPSSTYATRFNLTSLLPALQASPLGGSLLPTPTSTGALCVLPVSSTVRVWTGATAVSPVIVLAYGATRKQSPPGVPWNRVCWNVTFNRPASNPLLWTGGPLAPWAALHPADLGLDAASALSSRYAPDANLTATLTDGGQNSIQVCGNVAAARVPASAALLFPAAPTVLATDAAGIPVYGGPWGSPTVTSMAGLYATLSLASAEAVSAVFAVVWSFPVAGWTGNETDLGCTNCAVVNVTLVNATDSLVAVAHTGPGSVARLSLLASTAAVDAAYSTNRPVAVEDSFAEHAFAPASASATGSASGSASASAAATESATATGAATGTATVTDSATATVTGSATAAATGSATAAATGSATGSSSPTASSSATGSASGSAAVSTTASGTPSADTTPSASLSAALTASSSGAATGSASASAASTVTATATGAASASATAAATDTATRSGTATPLPTVSASSSASETGGATTSGTGSVGASPSHTESPTSSAAVAFSPSFSSSIAATSSASATAAATAPGTQSVGASVAGTAAPSQSATATSSSAASSSGAATASASTSAAGSSAVSASASTSPTASVTASSSAAATATPTASSSVAASAAASFSSSHSGTRSALSASPTPSLALAPAVVLARFRLPLCFPQQFRDSPHAARALRRVVAGIAGVPSGAVVFVDVCCVAAARANASSAGSVGGNATAAAAAAADVNRTACVEIAESDAANADAAAAGGERRLQSGSGGSAAAALAEQQLMQLPMVVSVRVVPPPSSVQLAASTTGLAANTSAPASANVRDRLDFLSSQSALLASAASSPDGGGGGGGSSAGLDTSAAAAAARALLTGLFAGVVAALANATGADPAVLMSSIAAGGYGVDPELRVGAPLPSPSAAAAPLPLLPPPSATPGWLGAPGAIAGLVVSGALLTGLCLLAVAVRRHVLKNREADADAAEAAPAPAAAPLTSVV